MSNLKANSHELDNVAAAGSEVSRLLKELGAQLRYQKVDGIPQEWFRELVSTSASSASVTVSKTVSESGALPSDANAYAILREQALSCTKCRLHETRNKVVFGCGAIDSPPIAFVGEGPGADEDRVGEPFVGKAGALLTAAITKGLKLNREQVYICNVVKCRPPQNRTPAEDEVVQCFSFLEQQLSLVSPKVIVTLGAPALRALTGSNEGITRARGKWMDWKGIALMPTFHPAYILRKPEAKREFWADLQAVIAKLDLLADASAVARD